MMEKQPVLTAVILEDEQTYTVVEVCQLLSIPEDLIVEMEEHGLFQYQNNHRKITQHALKRIESACRIHQDLGVNLPGVALALDLVEELEKVRIQLLILERSLK